MPLFSRGHFLEIGNVLRHEIDRYPDDGTVLNTAARDAVGRVIFKLADAFELDNRGFERERFLKDVLGSLPNAEDSHGTTRTTD